MALDLQNVSINATKNAEQTGAPTAILVINGIAAWIPMSETASILERFPDAIHSIILPMKWILEKAEKPS